MFDAATRTRMRDPSRFRTAVDAALDLLLPARCAGCGGVAGPCCAACLSVFAAPGMRDPVSLRSVPAVSLAAYRGTARELVLQHKERGRRDLGEPLGSELVRALPLLPQSCAGIRWLVPVPSRRAAARVRGGTHTRGLAGACARSLSADGYEAAVAPALRMRRGVRDTAGLSRGERVRNLAGRVALVPAGAPPRGSPVVLVDDVITTGATAASCVSVLRAAGYPVTGVVTLTAAC